LYKSRGHLAPGSWLSTISKSPTAGSKPARTAQRSKELTEIYTLDSNHVAMVFKPGGALEASA
jgi:hypothetical protein